MMLVERQTWNFGTDMLLNASRLEFLLPIQQVHRALHYSKTPTTETLHITKPSELTHHIG
jgi:hypothetical protein